MCGLCGSQRPSVAGDRLRVDEEDRVGPCTPVPVISLGDNIASELSLLLLVSSNGCLWVTYLKSNMGPPLKCVILMSAFKP